MGALTILQQSNHDGFPKAAELIEIEGQWSFRYWCEHSIGSPTVPHSYNLSDDVLVEKDRRRVPGGDRRKKPQQARQEGTPYGKSGIQKNSAARNPIEFAQRPAATCYGIWGTISSSSLSCSIGSNGSTVLR